MNKSEARIVFMGTPPFAVPSLMALVNNGYHVVGVITAPDRPAGRGKTITHSAVKSCAMELGLSILQPENLKDPAFIDELKALKADLQIVVAFRMLPPQVWEMPPLGTFNLHASLLPQYRGAAPINHALINGETITGITTFLLDKEIDTGKILFQESIHISPDDDAGTLHDKLMELGSTLIIKTTDSILQGQIDPISQSEVVASIYELKKAPKIFKHDCFINWQLAGQRIHNFVRGLSPYPAAISILHKNNGDEISIKIFKTEFMPVEHDLSPGTIKTPDNKKIWVAVQDGFISIEELQQSGKKRLHVDEFLRGIGHFSPGYLR
ncbi:MAG: methionyl-tRNA formyltransferase [Bacteroidetes bacterium]|nr:methionyl-tRNA formyltransferase [Bacteroidota bacterium]